MPDDCGALLQQCRDELQWSLQQARACGMYSIAADCAFELAVLCDPVDKKQLAAQACLSQSLCASADVQTLMQATLAAESRERVMQRLVEHVNDCGWPMDCKSSVAARELLQKLSTAEQRCNVDAGDFEAVAAKQGAGCILLALASRCVGSQVRSLVTVMCSVQRVMCRSLFCDIFCAFSVPYSCRCCSWRSSLSASEVQQSLPP